MGRKELLLDSVKKLLELNSSDEEIITDLINAGITEKEARELLNEAKMPKGKIEKQVSSFDEDIKKAGGKSEEISEKFDFEKVEPLKDEKLSDSFYSQKQDLTKKSYIGLGEEKSLNELWEKGILATADTKLNEMKVIKSEINSTIDSKINDRIDETVKRINVLFDSQKILLLSKVDSELTSKSSELTSLIDSKIRELKELNIASRSRLIEFDKTSAEFEAKVTQVNSKLDDLNKAKTSLITEMNSELAKEKNKMESFLDETRQKRKEIDERIKRTLDLEQKLVEGLLADAKNKIDKFADEKKNESLAEVRSKEKELDAKQKEIDSLVNRINPDQLNERMAELKRINSELVTKAKSNEIFREFKNEMNLFSEKETDKIKKTIEKKAEEAIKVKSDEMDKLMKKNSARIDDLVYKVHPDELIAAKDELEIFQKQFVNVIQENITKFNEFKKELNSYMKEQQAAADKRIKLIDAKIEELNSFEENFAKEMGLQLEKLSKKKANKNK
ncbi:MAG: hypothetical protein ABIA76_01570 [Candidatus Diapherotrites archaeon]